MSTPTLQPILTTAAALRANVHEKVSGALKELFPLDLKGRTLELADVQVHSRDYATDEQKRALLTGATLYEPVIGTLVLKDASGKVLDEAKKFTLLKLPYFTERHTVIVDGNEYQVANMLRRKPGVYTQRAQNGELSTMFNLSKGKNFYIGLTPETGAFHLEYDSTKVPLYPVLRAFGVPHGDIAHHLGAGVADENRDAHGHQETQAIDKLYKKLVHPSVQSATASHEEKVEAVRAKYDQTAMNGDVTAVTLGERHDKVTPKALLDATRKLLHVHEGKSEVDDADSLAFKTFHSADDFLAERLKLFGRQWGMKTKLRFTGKDRIRDALAPQPFTDTLKRFITTSTLSAVPTGINPIELIDHSVKVTSLGEGGISSERAIPYESRLVHPTHYGVLDPIRTPECFSQDSEVFTAQGWKKWPEVDARDFIACRINGRLEFRRPTRLIVEQYSGVLYGVDTGKLSYLVTPNHRVLCGVVSAVYPLDSMKESAWRIERADEVHGKKRVFDTAHAPYQGEDMEFFQLPRVSSLPKTPAPNGGGRLNDNVKNVGPIPMVDWAEFMGWYLSEGCVGRRDGRLAVTRISQSKTANPDCCESIAGLLGRLPFTWHYSESGREFTISGKQLAEHLEPFGFCQDKYIPEYLFNVSVAARTKLLEALMLGDGRVDSKRATGKTYKQQVFCTSSPRLAADVERLAISLGYPVRTRRYANVREERFLDTYEVRLLQDRYRQISSEQHFMEQYDGMVYCATVPGGLMYVRRGDSVGHWSGNSGHAGVDIRATISAQRDAKGNLYTPVMNVKTGKREYLAAGDLTKNVVAFPHQKMPGRVSAFVNGKVRRVNSSAVTHQFIHGAQAYSPATTLVPLLHNIQGNRAIMGSKMQTQALPLVEREAPLVQVKSHRDESFEKMYAKLVLPVSPHDGVITKIEDGRIWIEPSGTAHNEPEKDVTKIAELEREDKIVTSGAVSVPFQTNFPFPSKTYLHHDLKVGVGDKVKAGQVLGESNFTKDETLALGKNLRVAYMAYRGLNSNDAVVISEGCAHKLTSEHMYREVYPIGPRTDLHRERHKVYYGSKYAPDQYAKLDDEGVIKPGSVVHPHELLVAGLTKSELTGTDMMLGRISKSLTRPFKDSALLWTHSFPGDVIEVVKTSGQIAILIKTREPMQIGDKLAGRYGNKGVVAAIIPDAEMVKDESGQPVDVVMTSAGVISRINPAQIIEGAVGKVAEKIGKPILVDNMSNDNKVEWAADLLKKHGVKDKEILIDPVTGRKIRGPDGKGVFVGRSFIFKLFKSTETNFAAHGVGPYDINEQPSKMGGEESPKGIAKMEFDALVAHNVRNVLHEASSIRSQKNEEFWRALQLGHPLPAPKPTFVWNKFTALLEGAGVKVDKRDSKIKLLPMTDKDILARSAGKLENNKTVMAKNMLPERGGLFDIDLTGGPQGAKFAHIELPEAVPNPVFEEPIRRLLGMTQPVFSKTLREKGGAYFKSELAKIDVDAKLAELKARSKRERGTALNDVVKQIKYLTALKEENLHPKDAYVLHHVPVIPPIFRPIIPMPNDPKQLMVSDPNKLYMHLMDANHVLRNTVLESDTPKHREHVYNAVSALFGTDEVNDDELRGQKVKGFLTAISGQGSPKNGFFQKKIMRRTQDVSGRGTAVPDVNLNMDQVGLPEDMLWGMYEPFIISRLVRTGYPALQAKEMVEKRHPTARIALMQECRDRPVFLNRAPTLHRYSIVGAYPIPVQGKTIRVNPFIEKGMNLDYDGDTLQVHAPITPQGSRDVQQMFLRNQLLLDQTRNKLVAFPQHESIIGVTHASNAVGAGATKTFKSIEEVEAAWRKGELSLNDVVKLEEGLKNDAHSTKTPITIPRI